MDRRTWGIVAVIFLSSIIAAYYTAQLTRHVDAPAAVEASEAAFDFETRVVLIASDLDLMLSLALAMAAAFTPQLSWFCLHGRKISTDSLGYRRKDSLLRRRRDYSVVEMLPRCSLSPCNLHFHLCKSTNVGGELFGEDNSRFFHCDRKFFT
ncbi:hypothetical protein ACH5RR_021934 [Cinchona calisaya]|uniref:Uncharacterized protein n=1 Tax=Cinchona calisaya TaxID=153742 RepID=A0ABD2Z9M6_9GENT